MGWTQFLTVPAVSLPAHCGNPDALLAALDGYSQTQRWLMNFGSGRQEVLDYVKHLLPQQSPRILEMGSYCGYSSILFCKIFGAETKIETIELNESNVLATKMSVEHARLSEQVCVHQGMSSDVMKELQGPFDMVFFDHEKTV